MKYRLLLLLLFISQPLFAEIYKLTDKNGNITYTDTPEKGAEKVEITAPPLLHDAIPPSASVEQNKVDTLQTTEQKKPYTVFVISSPLNEETIHNNPNIMITIAIEPDLQKGDKIQVFVDERPIGDAVPNTQISIGRLERGIHQVKAVVIDENQKILKISPSITIYAHYGIKGRTS